MAFRILDRAQMSVTGAPGTGNITLGVNTTGYQTFAQAGLTDGDTFSYIAVDGTAWEYGVGTYTLATGVVARTPTKTSAQSATPLSLSSKTVISATLRGEDIQSAGTTLAGLSDVSVTEGAAIDGYTLNWSNSTGRWVAVAPVTGGGGSTTLAALTDVQETSPASGQYLKYNGTKWINASLPTIPTTIETLTDVTVTSPTSGQVLEWNGSAWVNSTVSGGGGGALIINNNSTLVDSAATTLNFVNATSITTSAHNVTVTLPTGGSGTSSWTPLTFSGTVSSFPVSGTSRTFNTSVQSFTLTQGDIIEIEGYVHRVAGTTIANTTAVCVSPDGSNGYAIEAQYDGNFVIYYYSTNQTPIGAVGQNSVNDYTGYYKMRLSLAVSDHSSEANLIWGQVDGWISAHTIDSGHIEMATTVKVYLQTDDTTKCNLRARVVNSASLSTIFN